MRLTFAEVTDRVTKSRGHEWATQMPSSPDLDPRQMNYLVFIIMEYFYFNLLQLL